VERVDGTAMGKVRSVQDHGAGPIVEIETANGQTSYLPFTKRAVPEVDVEGGRIVVDPPEEVEWKARKARASDRDGVDGDRSDDLSVDVPRTLGASLAVARSSPACGRWRPWTSATSPPTAIIPSMTCRSAAAPAW